MTERASPPVTIRALDAAAYRAAIPDLAALLVDAVAGGASVNFVAGVTPAEAAAWWSQRIDQVRDGVVTPLVAVASEAGEGEAIGHEAIVGSLLLIRSTNPNSPHRAEIGKVLVHQSARRRGIGAALMHAAEERARADGRWLLILDTVTGSAAESMYRSLGWTELGVMPNHALLTDGTPAATTFFWKDLR